jgi:hypothetical protein
MSKTEGDSTTELKDPTLEVNDSEVMTVTMPKNPDRITFEAEEIMIGTDKLCMFGEWGIDFEQIQTLEFIMGEKKEKKFVFKKV